MFIDRIRNEDSLESKSEEELIAELERLHEETRKEGIVIGFPKKGESA